MGSARGRPAPFPPGTQLGEHFVVDSLRRLCEGRMIYVVNDHRPDKATRHCWICGSDGTPRDELRCVSCGEALAAKRQYMMSVRWDKANFALQKAFHEKGLEHPALLRPEMVFETEGQLCSVVQYRGESLMVTLPAPFDAPRVLHLSQRFAGLLAYLHRQGIALEGMGRHSFVYRRAEDRFLLFDPTVSEVSDSSIREDQRSGELKALSAMLRLYTAVNHNVMRDFLQKAEDGGYESPMSYGRAVERLFNEFDDKLVPAGMAAMSDVGLARNLNEDNWGWVELGAGTNLYAVADGMGGHEAGEVASEMAIKTICSSARQRFNSLKKVGPESLENLLDESFQQGNNSIKDEGESRGSDMGTTLVACLVHNGLGLVANVGDSRAYLMRGGNLHQVSRDHSLVARLVEQGRIEPDEAKNHPHSHILLRTVGTERDVEIDIFRVEFQEGDQIIMCSDGLWGEVEDDDLEAILNHYDDPRVCVQELVKAAHLGGGRDNVTVMVLTYTSEEDVTASLM
jgi:serine/threonine protein phosphatase PrpC